MKRVSIAAALVALFIGSSVPQAQAFGPSGSCGRSPAAVLAVREQQGSLDTPGVGVARSGCEFVVACPGDTPLPGCRIELYVEVSGTGLVEANIEGPFGNLWCGPVPGGCSAAASTLMQPRDVGVVHCSSTGASAQTTYRCEVS